MTWPYFKPQQASISPATVPAPVGGINALSGLAMMQPNDAIYTKNIDATLYGLKVRPGYQEYANGFSGDEVWISEGTSGDTSLVKDINATPLASGSDPSSLTVLNGKLYFRAEYNLLGLALPELPGPKGRIGDKGVPDQIAAPVDYCKCGNGPGSEAAGCGNQQEANSGPPKEEVWIGQ